MLEILSAKMMANNKQCIVKTKQDDEDIDFIYTFNSEDETEMYKAITDEINSGKLKIEPANPDQINAFNQFTVRETRNELLSETDKYFSISDYPISEEKKNEIRVYRQALRDIPQQDGFPNNIVWPEKPAI